MNANFLGNLSYERIALFIALSYFVWELYISKKNDDWIEDHFGRADSRRVFGWIAKALVGGFALFGAGVAVKMIGIAWLGTTVGYILLLFAIPVIVVLAGEFFWTVVMSDLQAQRWFKQPLLMKFLLGVAMFFIVRDLIS